MQLNEKQKKAVADWFAAGASLDEIQKRIKAEFGIHFTYLDVRLLVAELPQPSEHEEAADEDRPAPAGGAGESAPASDVVGEGGLAQSGGAASSPPVPDAPGEEGAPVAGPQVTADAIMIPGTLASGDVTFSDGQKGKWYVDQMGRLGLGGDLPQGYRPSPTDAALFQQQLMSILQSKGLY